MRSKMKYLKITLCVLAIVSLLPAAGAAQNILDGRCLGMAGSNGAAALGLEYLGRNPAVLASEKDYSLEIIPVAARLKLSNNSFSLKEYDRYFTSGGVLSDRDKDDILAMIPENGMLLNAVGGVEAVSFSFSSVGVAFAAEGNGVMNIPKDAAEFLFYGNTRSDNIRFNELETDGWGGITVNMGIARKLSDDMFGALDRLTAGINFKYIRGLASAEIIRAEGGVVTTDEYILADGLVNFKTSEGGSGFGADIGFTAAAGNNWMFSLGCSNILGGVNWNSGNKMQVFEYNSDSLSAGGDQEFDPAENDTSYSIGDYYTPLNRSLNVAAACRTGDRLLLTAAWNQGINESMGGTCRPRFSVGAEYCPWSFLPLRTGMAYGGRDDLAVGLGMGIRCKALHLDVGYLNHSFDWFRSARSVDLAFSTRLRF